MELHYATALSVTHADADGLLPTTATAILYKPDGTQQQAPTVTKPSFASTVAAGSTRETLILASVTGCIVGRRYRVISKGVTQTFVAARVDATAKTVALVAALQDAPDTNSPVVDLTMSASLTAPGVALVGAGYRLDWQYSAGGEFGFHSQAVAIVRWKWSAPCTASRVREYLAVAYRSVRKSEEYFGEIAERANDRIDRAVSATNRRPHLYGDADVWKGAGLAALRYELALDGLTPQGSNVGLYQQQLLGEVNAEIATVISSLQDYDADGDGAISEPESRGLWWSVETTR